MPKATMLHKTKTAGCRIPQNEPGAMYQHRNPGIVKNLVQRKFNMFSLTPPKAEIYVVFFKWANFYRGRESIRWKTDGNCNVISFSRQVLQ